MKKQIIKLQGLHCEACKKLTEKKISKLDEVLEVVVSIENSIAEVTANRDISLSEINLALEGTPYEAYE